MEIRVAIFEDNKLIRDALQAIISGTAGYACTGTFASCNRVIEDIKRSNPDVVMMDIEMPGMNGIEAVRLIKKELPEVLILMQTVFEDDDNVFDSICAGAAGYILKNFLNTKLIDSIRELEYGGSPMSPTIARKVLAKMQQIPQHISNSPEPDYKLTPREKEVLACVVNGLSYKMIADALFISYETVRSHIKHIYEKLHVASLTEVVHKAITERIVKT